MPCKLPSYQLLCDQLDKINWDFLCCHDGDNNPMHLVNWDTMANPLDSGGLGVEKAKFKNQTLLAKVGGDFISIKT